MMWRLLRGICSVTAAVTGLSLAYGFIYAMEGVTTRIPTSPLRELGTTSLWMVPWMLLYCSGLEDFVAVTRKTSVFWLGLAPALAFLYYLDRYTSSDTLTKAAMPLFATVGGLLPHVIRRIVFVFTVCALLAGVAGVVVLYYTLPILLTRSFATRPIGFLNVVFAASCLASGVLSVAFLWRCRSEMTSAN